jgi:hypothetical protein
MATQRLLAIIEVDEDRLGEGNGYNELPDKIVKAIDRIPALEVETIFLLNPKLNPTAWLNALALNYHHYAVSVRGEKCTEKNCEQHSVGGNVIHFNAHHIRRNNSPQGFN